MPLLIMNMAEAHARWLPHVAELICEDAQGAQGCQKIGHS